MYSGLCRQFVEELGVEDPPKLEILETALKLESSIAEWFILLRWRPDRDGNAKERFEEDEVNIVSGVKFPEDNPFMGFYMRKVASKDLIKFDVTFKIDDNRVEICKDRIIVNTDSITELAAISRDILVLPSQ